MPPPPCHRRSTTRSSSRSSHMQRVLAAVVAVAVLAAQISEVRAPPVEICKRLLREMREAAPGESLAHQERRRLGAIGAGCEPIGGGGGTGTLCAATTQYSSTGRTPCSYHAICPAGQYTPSGRTRFVTKACVSCALGYTFKSGASSSTARTTQDSCSLVTVKTCPAGQGFGDWTTPRGTPATSSRDGYCTSCNAGYFSPSGTADCSMCGTDNKYSAVGAGSCATCPTGSYTGGCPAYLMSAVLCSSTTCTRDVYDGSGNLVSEGDIAPCTRTTCTLCRAGYQCDGSSTGRTTCGADNLSLSLAALLHLRRCNKLTVA